MVMITMLDMLVLAFDIVDDSSVIIQIKATEQHFPIELFIPCYNTDQMSLCR